MDFNNLSNFENQFIQFKEHISQTINNIDNEVDKSQLHLELEEILKGISDLKNLKNLENLEEKFIDELKKILPHFILFSSFADIFPNEIPFAELGSNEWIKDLKIISDLDSEKIRHASNRNKVKHKDDVNLKLNNDYKDFWTQDATQLSVEWDSDSLFFWIKEDGYSYEPNIRSKGRQWHLAFYIRVTARAKEEVKNIILIDEPGLFLHAKAQKDILKKLENSSKETQLIFSTHSPYLLETEHLNRIKLIHKTDQEGTKIENKVHALADKETLTPILTTIGLGLSSGITHLNKNNIVVEGISDFYYLNAFKKTLYPNRQINFIFGGGSGNIPCIGAILHGWGCKVLYLYDNDKGGKDGKKNLKKNWKIPENLILTVIDNQEGTIEGIFSKDDFKKYVLKKENEKYNQSNSKYLKNNKLDKIILAKEFLESTENITISETTKKNIDRLFEKIESSFK